MLPKPQYRDPRYRYVQPTKPKFGQILNANHTIKRDLNKDLMMKTQIRSEVKSAAKNFFRR